VIKKDGKKTRREFLRHAAICGGGIVSAQAAQGYAGAAITPQDVRLKDLKGSLPQGNIGKLKISRVILGSNLMGGGAHSRDLAYAGPLMRAYHTEAKILETLELAERASINTFLPGTGLLPLFNKYRKLNSSQMQTICQVMPSARNLMTETDKAIDFGATTIYVNGTCAAWFIKTGRIDSLGKLLEHIKSQGCLAGVGAHSIEVPIQCEKAGLQPDYYMKTLHHDQYWSAHPRESRVEFSIDDYYATKVLRLDREGSAPPDANREASARAQLPTDHNQWYDNMFDLFPEKTIAHMQAVKTPWIAFKVLAGGAILPPDGFKFAFENGADFICVGMLDFQIVQNVNTALDVLANVKSRPRPWCA
jgi:hypothetical protein